MRAIKRNMRDQILTNDRKILHCPACDAEYSGNRGDYWHVSEDHIFNCEKCQVEMELVTKRVYVEYE
jgi:peptide subunit release factor 1 (eRF1)